MPKLGLLGSVGSFQMPRYDVVPGAVMTAVLFVTLLGENEHDRTHVYNLFDWLHVGGFDVKVGFLLDPLSVTMALFITGVGALIHLYSIAYMHGDPKFSKYFVYLNLFVFSMLMLVLGSNLLLTFLGWEGVGACSYFLIAFWFSKEANASAGKKLPKALYITNRNDDRVHPGHGRKMVARLQGLGQDALLFEPRDGGHSGRATPQSHARREALIYTFLMETLRPKP